MSWFKPVLFIIPTKLLLLRAYFTYVHIYVRTYMYTTSIHMCVCIIVLWFKLVLFVLPIKNYSRVLILHNYICAHVHTYLYTTCVCMYKHHICTKYSITIFTRYTRSTYIRRYMYTQTVALTI